MPVRALSSDEEGRLTWLMERKQRKEHLSPAERLEMRELRARRSAAAWLGELDRVEARKRKAADRVKYVHGGLVAKAGLGGWSDDELLGLLLTAVDASPVERQGLAEVARQFHSSPARALTHLRLVFPEEPGRNILVGLRRRKFIYDEQAKCWTGMGNLAEMKEEAALGGGTVEVIAEVAAAS